MSNVRLCVRLKGTGVAVYWGGGVGVGIGDGEGAEGATGDEGLLPQPNMPKPTASSDSTRVARFIFIGACLLQRNREWRLVPGCNLAYG